MKRSGFFFGFVLILTVLATSSMSIRASAAQPNAYFYAVRRFRTADLPEGAGLAYDDANGLLLALRPADLGRTVLVQEFDRVLEDARGETEAAVTAGSPLNITFDPGRGRLLAYGANSGVLTTLARDPSRPSAGWQAVSSQRIGGAEEQAGLPAAEGSARASIRGMALNTDTGILYLLDEQAKTITGYRPGAAQQVQQIRLVGMRETQPRGLAWNPDNGHFYTADVAGGRIFEIGADGTIAAVMDLSEAGLKITGGMAFAPSGDETDDPAEHSLYITAPARQGGKNQIVELTLTAPPQAFGEEAQMMGLVRTINAYAWRPSSPDPSGISFWPAKGGYLVSDGEVEGYPDFTGDNLYQMTSTGTLQTTYSAMSYTSEPTGVAVNKTNGEIYISEDNGRKVYVVNTGPDGQLQTSDDRITSFSTNNSVYKSTDPEGVGWGQGLLFIVDGTNSQVYVLSPGPNGRFDGVVSPGDDDLVRQFDTEAWGVADPEGIDYNAQTGTLFIAGNNSRDVLIECKIDGTLVAKHNISALPSMNPAGIGIGPSSRNPQAYSIYMTDRGTDAIGPNTHDGKIFEIEVYEAPDPPTPTPYPHYLPIIREGVEGD